MCENKAETVKVLKKRFRLIEGRMKTLVEIALPESRQQEALKETIQTTIWGDYNGLLDDLNISE